MIYGAHDAKPMPLKGVLLCWAILFGFLAIFTGPAIAAYAAIYTLVGVGVACGILWLGFKLFGR